MFRERGHLARHSDGRLSPAICGQDARVPGIFPYWLLAIRESLGKNIIREYGRIEKQLKGKS
jgi:hypothetical protein